MKRTLLPVTNLVKTINDYVDGGMGNDIAYALVTQYTNKVRVDLNAFFSEFIEEEWIVLKLVLDIKDKLNQLDFHLNNYNGKVSKLTINDLGVTIYGTE